MRVQLCFCYSNCSGPRQLSVRNGEVDQRRIAERRAVGGELDHQQPVVPAEAEGMVRPDREARSVAQG